jgi:ketosteroid isomerase-like protein
VLVDALLNGRSAYNGAELSQRFWIVWTVRDGKAVHGVHFADEAQALAFDR